ncbi:hypothetical protein [Xanthomonas hortorum]|uniref:Uncharacterized protein n=1 Tax=Xanthomonas hortorum TaxID=56454 RepID=A0AA47IAA0_9XANT|nr:hypothetical protein [Xanthomonas hortorum]WAH63287.1 hypothetical protein OEG85_17665 [Xanthomonas hortorum]
MQDAVQMSQLRVPIEHHPRLHRLIRRHLQPLAAHEQQRTIQHERRLELRLPCWPLQRDAAAVAVFEQKMHAVIGRQPHGGHRPALLAAHRARQRQSSRDNWPAPAHVGFIHTSLVIKHQGSSMRQWQHIHRHRRCRLEGRAASYRTRQLHDPAGLIVIAAAQYASMKHAWPAVRIEPQHGAFGRRAHRDGHLLVAGTPAQFACTDVHTAIGLPAKHAEMGNPITCRWQRYGCPVPGRLHTMQLVGTQGETLPVGSLPDTGQLADRRIGQLTSDLVGRRHGTDAALDRRMHGKSCDQQAGDGGEERLVAWHARVVTIRHVAQQTSTATQIGFAVNDGPTCQTRLHQAHDIAVCGSRALEMHASPPSTMR